jgi:hypothetical protein
MRTQLLFFLTFLSLAGCRDGREEMEPQLSDGTFLFTKYHCFCSGSCISGYRLSNNELFYGTGQGCDPATLEFETTPLAQADADLAIALRDALPASMFTSPEEIYGCPDCGDWGGYYVEFQQNGGTTRMWRLDTQFSSLPPEVKAFAEKIQQTLDALN